MGFGALCNVRNFLVFLWETLKNAKIFQSYGKWYIINNSSYSEQSVKDSSATTANGGAIPTGIRAAETTSLQNNGTESIKYFIYNSSGVYQSTSTVDILQTVPTDLQPLGANLTKEYLESISSSVKLFRDCSWPSFCSVNGI